MIVSPVTEIIRIVDDVSLLTELFTFPEHFIYHTCAPPELFTEKACQWEVPGRQYGRRQKASANHLE